MNESCLICMSHVSYEWVMSHMHESCLIWMSHFLTWMSHVSYEWVMSRMNESCYIYTSHVSYAWVMSHMNEPCLICMSHVSYEWVMSHMHESRLIRGRQERIQSAKGTRAPLSEPPHTLSTWPKTRETLSKAHQAPATLLSRAFCSKTREMLWLLFAIKSCCYLLSSLVATWYQVATMSRLLKTPIKLVMLCRTLSLFSDTQGKKTRASCLTEEGGGTCDGRQSAQWWRTKLASDSGQRGGGWWCLAGCCVGLRRPCGWRVYRKRSLCYSVAAGNSCRLKILKVSSLLDLLYLIA